METKIEGEISKLEEQVVIPEKPVLPGWIENTVEVNEGGVTAYYRGTLSGLYSPVEYHFSWPAEIEAQRIELARFEKQTKHEVKRQIHLLPPRLEKRIIKREDMKEQWASILTNIERLEVEKGAIIIHKYTKIMQNGVIESEYRAQLADKIFSEHQVRISQELLGLVFDPMVKQIEEYCKKAANWYGTVSELKQVK